MTIARTLPLLALSATLVAMPALARQADRQQPMDVVSDQVLSNLDNNGKTTFTGNVVVNQGSLEVQAAAGTLQTRDGDITHAHFTGQPVKLNQDLDDGTRVDTISREVQYDMATDTITLIGDVVLNKPTNTLRGERVVYNMRTGKINADGQGGSGRVEMRILPRIEPVNLAAPGAAGPTATPEGVSAK